MGCVSPSRSRCSVREPTSREGYGSRRTFANVHLALGYRERDPGGWANARSASLMAGGWTTTSIAASVAGTFVQTARPLLTTPGWRWVSSEMKRSTRFATKRGGTPVDRRGNRVHPTSLCGRGFPANVKPGRQPVTTKNKIECFRACGSKDCISDAASGPEPRTEKGGILVDCPKCGKYKIQDRDVQRLRLGVFSPDTVPIRWPDPWARVAWAAQNPEPLPPLVRFRKEVSPWDCRVALYCFRWRPGRCRGPRFLRGRPQTTWFLAA